MIKKQNKQILVKGPPGLIVRKSRDSLRMFGVRGDPELNEPGNLTGFEHLSGLNPTVAPIFIGSKALLRPRNDGQTITSSLRATEGSVAICRRTGTYNNNVYSSMQMDCFGLLRRPRNDGQTLIASSLRATAGSVAICQILEQVQDDKYDEDDMKQILNRVQENKKKDCVRVELDSRVFPKNWSKLGFHRTLGKMKRNLTGFENLSGLIPKNDCFALSGRSRNDAQTTKSSLRATKGNVASCRRTGTYNNVYSSIQMDCFGLLRRPRNDGQILASSSLQATAGSVAICQGMNVESLKQVQDDKKDCVRMDDFPMGFLRN